MSGGRGIAMAIVGATWLWFFKDEFDKPDDKLDGKFLGVTFGWFVATLIVIAMDW